MIPADQGASAWGVGTVLVDTRYTRQLGLLKRADEPMSSRSPIEEIPVVEIASISEAGKIGRRNRQVLAGANRPKIALLVMEAEPIVVPRARNQKPASPGGQW